jgi:hypothetical protein
MCLMLPLDSGTVPVVGHTRTALTTEGESRGTTLKLKMIPAQRHTKKERRDSNLVLVNTFSVEKKKLERSALKKTPPPAPPLYLTNS